ncbi:MAG: asparagine synthase (glutamine-hydrolyzing) [Vicinamibacterales bacterium]
MCGICGELRLDAAGRVDEATIVAMRDQLVHRGPDDQGVYVAPDGRAGLGFRRLQIIDLTLNARQPMTNEDGSVHVVFNGEIYNYQALRAGLVARGHRFRSQSDTEVIVHLYEEKGADCIADLDGMFAIGIWDERAGRLTLARDRAGKKPLYVYQDGAHLAFASEIKAFFAHGALDIEIDPEAVPYYFLYGYVPYPRTFYRRVRQIPPATVSTFTAAGHESSTTYWKMPVGDRPAPGSTGDPVARVRELLTSAVERRMVSDVPLGAFLSGGLDSSIIVGLMSRLSPTPVKTFAIGFEGDARYDETRYAREVAEKFGAEHTEFRVSPSSVDLLDRLIWHHDGPFGDSSAVPTYIVSRLTREQVTVVLTGDGGDELFAGYLRFRGAVLSERVPALVRRGLSRLAGLTPRAENERHWLARGRRFGLALDLPLAERMTRWTSLFYDDLDQLLHPDLVHTLAGIDRVGFAVEDLEGATGVTTLDRVLYSNYKAYLANDLLVKVDRCSMANSLEARSPFLDTALVEFAAQLPDALKLDGAETKVILRRAFADLLPPSVQQRGKMGFGVPLGTWFRGELREMLNDLVLAPDARHRQYLSAGYVEQVVRRHQAGHADMGHQLWSLLCFEQWLRLLPDWLHHGAPVAACD